MLRILGNPKRACDGITRREFLVAGGLEALGLGGFLRGSAAPAATSPGVPRPPGRAKSVICLFLFGGVSQLDTFDPKPDAPPEIRGDFLPIATTVAGLHVGERLPLLAQRMHHLALVRSVTSKDANHNTGLIRTGHEPRNTTLLKPSDSDWPFFMSALEYLGHRAGRIPRTADLPAQLCVPNRLGLLEGYQRPGPYGGFLGRRYDPLCTQFGRSGEHLFEPGGVNPRTLDFTLPHTRLGPDLTLDQLHRRHGLLQQLDHGRRHADAAVGRYDRFQQQALGLMTSASIRAALDLNREPAAVRERYGWHLFGQGVLLARRLVEAGVPLVTALWDCTKESQDISLLSWDTHWDHFKACKGWLLPGFDQAASALLDDLEARGLLRETLVVCLSEMGRTPQINKRAGRDHWVGSYCAWFAGAGVRGGVVHGRSDRAAAYVASDPVSPGDLLATVYHCLGYGPETALYDQQQRQLPLYDGGQPVSGILA
jgi:hypothetical protein